MKDMKATPKNKPYLNQNFQKEKDSVIGNFVNPSNSKSQKSTIILT